MFERIKESEHAYKSCFSDFEERDNKIRYWDDKLPDMRAHNHIVVSPELMTKEFILDEIALNRNKDYLKIITYQKVAMDHVQVDSVPEIDVYDFLAIDTSLCSQMKYHKSVEIKHAVGSILEDGRRVDIDANKQAMTEAFAIKRIDRKIEIYTSEQPLEFYVAYYNDIPVGNCELLIDGDLAKIEDFDILEPYQRQGIGTHFLKYLLSLLKEKSIEKAYVVTDHNDTAVQMYYKSGFKYIGSSTELLFTF